MPGRLASTLEWIKGAWKQLAATVVAPYTILRIIHFYHPLLLTLEIRWWLGIIALAAFVLSMIHYHYYIWAGEIEIDDTWIALSWGNPMIHNPAIRLGTNGDGDATLRFRLKCSGRVKGWALWMTVDHSAVIQDYGPKYHHRFQFRPELDDIGNHHFLCVKEDVAPTGASAHLVTIRLSDESFPPGSHIQFKAKVGRNPDSGRRAKKCKHCKGDKCKQSGMKTIVDMQVLVVPPPD